MLDRRSLFMAGTAITSFLSAAVGSQKALAKGNDFDVDPRGSIGRMERLPTLDLESQQDFLTGIRAWSNSKARKAAEKRFADVLLARGLDTDADLPLEEVIAIAENDPVIGMSVRMWLGGQQLTWSSIQDFFHKNADTYLAEMEAADKSGPGSLDLNPDMDVPDYTKHEIHIQPGGYVGDPFAGHINHYGVNAFYAGRNYQDQVQKRIASKILIPKDGKVGRIIDLGCATGRLTYALKERFPDAEVVGVDVGGPMVRYAHLRGVDLGIDVHFSQRLAEDTKFPDNHFDLVTSYIMFHEVTAEAAENIVAEAYRILRPGGVFFPIDFRTGKQAPPQTAYRRFAIWWDHRWNNEVWRMQYSGRDFGDMIANIGFDVDETISSARLGHGAILATKPA